jgi:hypothetical protein
MKTLLIFILFLCSYSSLLAQENSLNRKNLVFVEAGGAFAAGIGLGYERYLGNRALTRFTARGGAGLIDHFSLSTYFAGSSFLFGKKYQAEVGFNYITRIDRSNFRSLDEQDEKIVNGIQSLIGFRYQNWSNGIFFRAFYVPPFGAFASWLPYGGLSLGYAFK